MNSRQKKCKDCQRFRGPEIEPSGRRAPFREERTTTAMPSISLGRATGAPAHPARCSLISPPGASSYGPPGPQHSLLSDGHRPRYVGELPEIPIPTEALVVRKRRCHSCNPHNRRSHSRSLYNSRLGSSGYCKPFVPPYSLSKGCSPSSCSCCSQTGRWRRLPLLQELPRPATIFVRLSS